MNDSFKFVPQPIEHVGALHAAAGRYAADMDSLSSLDAMPMECSEHPDEMRGILDQMRGAFPNVRVMGRGMM